MKKFFANIARIIVGVVFLFSGFVKMVDPVGFSYKLQEYFGAGVFNLEFLIPYALIIAVVIVIFEFLLGVFLLLGYAKKFTRWALLLLTIFFSILTFYTAFFHKVTDCGCFGDAIPLTPWVSFGKNVVLLLLIIFLFKKTKHLKPLFKLRTNKWIVFVLFIACLGITYQVLTYLPVIDFRPYKIGNNLSEKMVSNGPEIPPIHDFYLFRDGKDQTDSILHEKKVLFVVSKNVNTAREESWKAVKKATDRALKNHYDVIGLTSSDDASTHKIKEKYKLQFDFIPMDQTTVKTIIRANPGLLTLHMGTVTQKANWRDADNLDFE